MQYLWELLDYFCVNREGTGASMSYKTVLLVDDSQFSRLMVRTMILKELPAWRVVEAATGEEALRRAEADAIDFALVDLNMPGMGGMAAACLLLESHPEMNVSLLTANVQDTVRRRAENRGLGFMSKPPSRERIMAFLGGSRGADHD